MLPWSHQFQFAGYYAAIEKGFYAEEGLTVTLKGAVPTSDRYGPVLRGRAQYGVGDAGLLRLRAEGHPVVVLAQIFQHSPNILITKKASNIFSPYELIDKNIVLPENPASNAAVRAMLLETLGSMERLKILPRVYDDAALISGQVDAVSGSLSNDPFRLKQRGLAISIVDPRGRSTAVAPVARSSAAVHTIHSGQRCACERVRTGFYSKRGTAGAPHRPFLQHPLSN